MEWETFWASLFQTHPVTLFGMKVLSRHPAQKKVCQKCHKVRFSRANKNLLFIFDCFTFSAQICAQNFAAVFSF
jgi:hypothetical protein